MNKKNIQGLWRNAQEQAVLLKVNNAFYWYTARVNGVGLREQRLFRNRIPESMTGYKKITLSKLNRKESAAFAAILGNELPGRLLFTYSMEAEAPRDIGEFLQCIDVHAMRYKKQMPTGVDIVFKSTWPKSKILAALGEIEDGHAMIRSLKHKAS